MQNKKFLHASIVQKGKQMGIDAEKLLITHYDKCKELHGNCSIGICRIPSAKHLVK